MKIIAIDLGNTNTRVAVVEEQKIIEKIQTATGDLAGLIHTIEHFHGEYFSNNPMPIIICSVVPEVCEKICEKISHTFDVEPKVIGKDIPLPLKLNLTNEKTVGADRVVSAAMAFERMGKAVAVASFGTAITIDCVDENGVFLGGAILPGLTLCAQALSEHTAQLPLVQLRAPETPWGRNTEDAIAAGIIFGAVGALREIVERFATHLNQWPELIVTGGDSKIIAEHCDFIHAIVEDLQLMGIELTLELWAGTEE
jgi:type III pantothenate kinase